MPVRGITAWLAAALVAACGSAATPVPAGEVDASPADAAPVPDAPPPSPPLMAAAALDCGGEEIPDEPKIPCSFVLEDGEGAIVYDGAAYIEKRGRSSIVFDKPQYSLELRESLDTEIENPTDFFDMGAEADWILNGAYIDRALFRNVLLFETFQSFGGADRYAPEIRYVSLTLDGDYQGIYMLTERPKRDATRISIAGSPDGSSFVLKQDEEEGIRPVGFANGNWQLIYPHRDHATQAQRDGVIAWLDDWQSAIDSDAPDAELFAMMDLNSVVDFVLLMEFAKNVDSFFLSMHVYKATGGKLHFMPWDLDLSFGQPNYGDAESPEGWVQHRPWLITALGRRPAFRERLALRWAELRQDRLAREVILARIDWHLETIGPHIEDNFERWPIDEIQFLDDNLPERSSHAEELQSVRAWIDARLSWMDDHIDDYPQ